MGEGQLGSEISMCGFRSIRATGCLGSMGKEVGCSQSAGTACYNSDLRSGGWLMICDA